MRPAGSITTGMRRFWRGSWPSPTSSTSSRPRASTTCRCSPIPRKIAIARDGGRRFCPVAVTALMATRLDRIDDVTERALTEVLPESRAVVDQSRIDAATPWRADYRFVTNS